MRRADREKSSLFAMEVLRDCEYAALATVNADGTPYCIPVSPVLIEDKIYFHCALEGKKLDNIRQNNAVCISGVRYTKLLPENFTTEYESAVASGICEIIEDETEKIAVLRAICEKYAKAGMNKFNAQAEKSLSVTCVCKIRIAEITGKANINKL